MELYLFNNSFEQVEKDNVERYFKRFLLLIDYINENSNSPIFLSEEIYNVQFFEHLKLFEWLYVNEEYIPEFQDVKKLLINLLDKKIKSCDNETYLDIVDEINNMSSDDINEKCLLCFKKISDKVSYINSVEELIKAFRMSLKKNCTHDNFINLAKDAFPNLYLRNEIEDTIKTLSAPLQQYKSEICRHLIEINDKFQQIFEENRNKGLNEVVSIFQANCGIKCTLEGNQKSKNERLNFLFKTTDKQEINLLCEAHTKLEKTGQPGDNKYRFDRIYFHQGDERVCKDKILIAYIGEHL